MTSKIKRLRRLSRAQSTIRNQARAHAEQAERKVTEAKEDLKSSRDEHHEVLGQRLRNVATSSELMMLFEERGLTLEQFHARELKIRQWRLEAGQRRQEAQARARELRRTEHLTDKAVAELRQTEARQEQAANDDLAARRHSEAA